MGGYYFPEDGQGSLSEEVTWTENEERQVISLSPIVILTAITNILISETTPAWSTAELSTFQERAFPGCTSRNCHKVE